MATLSVSYFARYRSPPYSSHFARINFLRTTPFHIGKQRDHHDDDNALKLEFLFFALYYAVWPTLDMHIIIIIYHDPKVLWKYSKALNSLACPAIAALNFT